MAGLHVSNAGSCLPCIAMTSKDSCATDAFKTIHSTNWLVFGDICSETTASLEMLKSRATLLSMYAALAWKIIAIVVSATPTGSFAGGSAGHPTKRGTPRCMRASTNCCVTLGMTQIQSSISIFPSRLLVKVARSFHRWRPSLQSI